MACPTHKGLALTLAFAVIASSGCSKQANTESNLSRANDYFAAQQYDKAEKEYRDLLRVTPDNPLAMRRLGSIYQDQGQNVQAYPLLQKSAELAPDDLEVQLKFGLTLLSLGQFKDAREAALRVLEKEPGHQQALVLLANTTLGLNDVDAIRQYIEGLRAKDQDRIGYHLALGLLDLRQDNQTGAENEFKAVLALDPKVPEAHTGLAGIYWRRNDLAAAEASFKSAVQFSPARSQARLAYADFKLRTGALSEAKEILEDTLKEVPDFLPPQVALMKLACAERHDDCAERVQLVLARDAINFDAMFQDGLNNLTKGDVSKAIREFEYLSTTYSQNPQVRYQLAMAYLQFAQNASLANRIKALDSAENNLANALKLSPRFVAAGLTLAEIKMRKNSPAAAVDLLLPFVSDHTKDPRLYLLLGSAYLAQQQSDRAVAVYQQMISLFPKDPQPPFLIGRILLSRGQSAEARKQFEKSLEVFADFLPAVENLVDLDLGDKRFDDATSRIQKVIEKNPQLARPWVVSAKIGMAQRDLAKAEADLAKAIELDPKLEEAYLMRSQLLAISNRQDQAIAELKTFVETNKNEQSKTVSALLQLAMIQQSLNRVDASRAAYEKVLELTPNSATALNNLAFLYAENLGQIDKAYELAKKARELLPNEPRTADTFGWILFKKADYNNALRALQESADNLPDDPEVQYHLGMTQYMLGNEEPARVAFKKAAEAAKEFPQKADASKRLDLLASTGVNGPESRAKLQNYLQENPTDPLALTRLSQLQVQEGAVDLAVKTLEKVVATSPMFSPAIRQLALLYGQGKDDETKAYEVVSRARQAYPGDPDIAKTLGILNYRRGLIPQSVELLKEAAAKREDDPELLYYLGEDFRQLKQWTECKETLDRALSLKIPADLVDGAKRAQADCAGTSPL